jgi:hypothetical protein
MIVQDIVNAAKYSELSSTAVKENTDAILTFLNLGLLELYKRFPLKTAEVTYPIGSTTLLYSLPSNFMYPVAVYGENYKGELDLETKIPVNEEGSDLSIFIPNHKQVQIPSAIEGTRVSVIYVTKPETYTQDDLGSDVDLPETLIEALLHYIGYKAHIGIRGDAQAENNAHYIRFDASCKKARELGVAYPVESYKMPDRITDRGFA